MRNFTERQEQIVREMIKERIPNPETEDGDVLTRSNVLALLEEEIDPRMSDLCRQGGAASPKELKKVGDEQTLLWRALRVYWDYYYFPLEGVYRPIEK